MKTLSAYAAVFFFTTTAFMPMSLSRPEPVNTENILKADPKIQVAILLDVSGSMGGLIAQAKAQLWNMVTVMGKAKCEAGNPKIEIALYEYGRSTNDAKVGFIKQISPFTSDLDQLSEELFKLTINGSEEYCGQVIFTSLNELNWDPSSSNYKVIFIAGNEEFLQGTIHYTKACAEANKKGVIVNTIYCGDRLQGIREHWDLAGECGNGSFTNINQDAKIENIPTPYDSTLVVLNNKLNSTYIYYGEAGAAGYNKSLRNDNANFSYNNSVGLKRVQAKSIPGAYNNKGWDLIDASSADSSVIPKINKTTLPDSLKNKSPEELKRIVGEKSKERGLIQREIQAASLQRDKYIAEQNATTNTAAVATLETEVEKIIKAQVKRYKMTIE